MSNRGTPLSDEKELDELDWSIVNEMRREELTNNALAERLGVSEGTVRQRLKRLKDANVLRFRAQINPDALARQQLAVIAVSIAESRLLDEKARQIAALENVLSVSIMSGQYDLMAEILVDSNRGLVRFLTETLPAVEGIVRTESFLALRSYNKFV